MALDGQGNVWVADAWNRRIQKLDPNGRPLAQIGVPPGWESQSITNKPYLAVDGQGRVIATFPEQGRYAVFGPDGRLVSQVQLPANGTPVGVAVAPDGRILLADTRNNIVDAVAAP
jgi:sugar lactone lactonase YvrE